MYMPIMYDAYPRALFANLKDPLGKVGKLGIIMGGALGTDGSLDPMAPRQSTSSTFSVNIVSLFFSSLSTVTMKTLEAKMFVEGNGTKTRMRTKMRMRTKTVIWSEIR